MSAGLEGRLGALAQRWEELWLPEALRRAEAPPELRHRARVLVGSLTCLPLGLALVEVIGHGLGKSRSAAEDWVVLAILALVLLLPALRRGLPVPVAGGALAVWITLACLVQVYHSAGQALMASMMLTTFPAMAMVLLGLRGALGVGFLVVAGLGATAAGVRPGPPGSPGGVSGEMLQHWLLAVPIMVTLATTALVTLLETSRRRALEELGASRAQLEDSEARLRTVFDAAPVGMGLFRPDGTVLGANQIGRRMLADARDEPLDEHSFARRVHADDAQRVASLFSRALRGEQIEPFEYRWVREDGRIEWARGAVQVAWHPDGRVRFAVGTAEFITAQKEAEQRIRQLAFFDPVTGLPNRAYLVERLEASLVRAREGRHALGLLFLDLDGFKQVNDRHGHQTGDAVLAEVARRFTTCVRLSDEMGRASDQLHLSRFGGDEFVVLLSEVDGIEGCEIVAKRMARTLERPVRVHGLELDVAVSIGVAVYPDHGRNTSELLRRADRAMYQAKRRPGNFCCGALDEDAGA